MTLALTPKLVISPQERTVLEKWSDCNLFHHLSCRLHEVASQGIKREVSTFYKRLQDCWLHWGSNKWDPAANKETSKKKEKAMIKTSQDITLAWKWAHKKNIRAGLDTIVQGVSHVVPWTVQLLWPNTSQIPLSNSQHFRNFNTEWTRRTLDLESVRPAIKSQLLSTSDRQFMSRFIIPVLWFHNLQIWAVRMISVIYSLRS